MALTRTLGLCQLLATLLIALPALAESVYQQPADFVSEAFAGNAPPPTTLWLNADLRAELRQLLGHDMRQLRIRYWQQGQRSVWILNEVGRDLPITTGIIVNTDRIEAIKVLIFRESRGWEVRYPFFTDQFRKLGLTAAKRLDRDIDNITGATLSVNALRRQARTALLLADYTQSSTHE